MVFRSIHVIKVEVSLDDHVLGCANDVNFSGSRWEFLININFGARVENNVGTALKEDL